MALPKKVKIVEVGPRDGLQNEKTFIPTHTKIDLINRLSKTGITQIEATSFVSPKKIKQLADHSEVMAHIIRDPAVTYSVLIPNEQGMLEALAYPLTEIDIFTAVSETFCEKNINCTIAESLDRYEKVIRLAMRHGLKIRGYISCAVTCPYEGPVDPMRVGALTKTLLEMGCYEVSLGDTIGVATPYHINHLLEAVSKDNDLKQIAAHFHDTYGQALANIYAALLWGIQVIDSSIAGLGGCPYAKGASGNAATEDVVYLLNGLQIQTGIDLDKLVHIAWFISDKLGKLPQSKVSIARKEVLF